MFPTAARPPPLAGRLVTWPRTEPKVLRCAPQKTKACYFGKGEVTWQIRNNHGGGYSYRLCPATEPLTEACFKKHQLDFVADQQAVVFPDGTLLPIKEPVFVTDGTTPPGSMWSRMPSTSTPIAKWSHS